MKLYFSPGACSLASHIALREAGLPFDLVKVNVRERSTSDGQDFNAINAKGYVPALGLDSGEVLSEAPRSCSTSRTGSRLRHWRHRPARCRTTGCSNG